MKTGPFLLLLPGLLLQAPIAAETAAQEAVRVQVERFDERYRVMVEFSAKADLSAVMTQLTDYENLHLLHPSIVSSEVLSRSDTVTRVRVRTKRCVLFICFDFTQVTDVRQIGADRLLASMVPELSDYRYGEMDWQLSRSDGILTVEYRAEVEPAFWVPPIIGPWFVESELESVSRTMMENLLKRVHGETLDYEPLPAWSEWLPADGVL